MSLSSFWFVLALFLAGRTDSSAFSCLVNTSPPIISQEKELKEGDVKFDEESLYVTWCFSHDSCLYHGQDDLKDGICPEPDFGLTSFSLPYSLAKYVRKFSIFF